MSTDDTCMSFRANDAIFKKCHNKHLVALHTLAESLDKYIKLQIELTTPKDASTLCLKKKHPGHF